MAKKPALSPKQIKALAMLAAGQTNEAAATAAGVKVKRLQEWLRDPVFADELRLCLERMRQTFEARVMVLANNASGVVANLLEDKNPDRQIEGAKIAFNAAVRLSNRYKELQVEGIVAPAQPLVVFPPGTKFPWQSQVEANVPLEIPETVDAEEVEVVSDEADETVDD